MVRPRRTAAEWLIVVCGAWLVGLGMYFGPPVVWFAAVVLYAMDSQ